MNTTKNRYNLLIIGGGPAGIMAAYFASKNGKKVAIIERNSELGKKILITGKGRCNITNRALTNKEFAQQFGENSKFMLNLLYKFSPEDVNSFFESIGVEVVTERGGRVFPVKKDAKFVRDKLVDVLKRNHVDLITSTTVKKINSKNREITSVDTTKGTYFADNYLICTGGLSYPGTGSTGDGYKFLQSLGLKVVTTQPALTPLITEENWTKDVKNFNLKNVEISLFINNKKTNSKFGEAFFTFDGIGGPIVLDLSKEAITALNRKERVSLQINMKPSVDRKEFEQRVMKLTEELKSDTIINLLRKILPKDMTVLFMKLNEINKNLKCAELSKKLRKELINFIYELKVTITGSEGYKKAIITSGGLDLNEVEQETMKVKKYDNLYVSGEVLDLDAPTGGFNMQVCWSSGFVVGNSV